MFPAVFQLSSLNGINGFSIIGEGGDFGGALDSGGDLNGDGIDDIYVGARQYNTAYVVFGDTDGFPSTISVASLDGSNGFRINGSASGVGSNIADVGDLNGDGFDDLAVSAVFSAVVHVIYGSDAPFAEAFDLDTLDGTAGFRLSGGVSYLAPVDGAGDVNGDGVEDVILSSPDSGNAYVVFGDPSGFPAHLDLSALDGADGFRLRASGNYFPYKVEGIGDFNGDDIDDIAIGATGGFSDTVPGEVFVVYGRDTGFPASLDLRSLDGTDGFRLVGVAGGDRAGWEISAAGDVNGDGLPDVLVTAAQATRPAGYRAGEAYVVFGRSDDFPASLDLADLDGTNGFTIESAGGRLGDGATGGFDLNGDGLSDIAVGGYLANAVYVVYGSHDGFQARVTVADLDGTDGFTVPGVEDGDRLGWQLAHGDVNADGWDDLIAEAQLAGDNGEGAAYVIYGKAATDLVTLRIGATGGPAHDPAFRVYADGVEIGQGVVENPQTAAERRASGVAFAEYVFPVAVAPESVTIQFVNDGRDPLSGEDLNLFVQSASFGGETYTAEANGWYDPSPEGIESRASGAMWWCGTLEIAPPQTVEIEIGGTGGTAARPAFEVWADGEKIGQGLVENPQTNAERCETGVAYATYSFEAARTPGSVEVRFVNDGRDPVSGEDVNLFVKSATFGGETYTPQDDGWYVPATTLPVDAHASGAMWWNGVLEIGEDVAPPEEPDLLFADDFSGGALSADWTVVHPNAWVEDGWLHQQDTDGWPRDAQVVTHDSDANWDDYSVRLKADFASSTSWDHFIIVLRSDGFKASSESAEGSAYIVWFNGSAGWQTQDQNKVMLRRADLDNGSNEELFSGAWTPLDGPMEVVAAVDDGRIRVWVEDSLIFDVTDQNPLSYGGLGFHTIWESHARFDDIEVVAGSPEDAGWIL